MRIFPAVVAARFLTVIFSAAIALPLAASGQSAASVSSAASPQSCERLAGLSLPHAKVTLAQLVAPGTFSQSPLFRAVPPFCRLAVTSTPTPDSDIKIEVWMPASGWNGKFQALGNGGFAGELNYQGMGMELLFGYATAVTDTGHLAGGTDARWALGHPEKIADFGYRAVHEMTLTAKAAIHAFYGNAPRYSYFGSCSNGGREALMEAQRFPDDYDGILAGAPANFWTHLLSSAIWDAQALTHDPASYIPSSKLPAIAGAVNKSCDSLDGVIDGILNDPRQCHFDPASIECQGADSDSCLTRAQVTTLKKLYEGAHDSHGRLVYPGFLPGAETGEEGWALWITGTAPGQSLLFDFGDGFFANMVFDRSGWTYKDAGFDDVVKAADEKFAAVLNATDPHLAPFRAHGGKLIVYHGWNDPAISALNSVNYYESVVKALGQKDVDSFLRLYMVPGMQHCGGGPGAIRFGPLFPPTLQGYNNPQHNIQLALEDWVENGKTPSAIIATKFASGGASGDVQLTRPLCPYPQSARYKGTGDSNDASNFVCAPPK